MTLHLTWWWLIWPAIGVYATGLLAGFVMLSIGNVWLWSDVLTLIFWPLAVAGIQVGALLHPIKLLRTFGTWIRAHWG